MSAASPETIQKRLFAIAREQRLVISFRRGRRSNDILVMHVEGDSSQVMDFYEAIEAEYPEFALELFNIPDSPDYGLTSALTEPQEIVNDDGTVERRTHIHPLELFSRPVREMQELKLGKSGRPPSKQGYGTVSTLAELVDDEIKAHKDTADTPASSHDDAENSAEDGAEKVTEEAEATAQGQDDKDTPSSSDKA